VAPEKHRRSQIASTRDCWPISKYKMHDRQSRVQKLGPYHQHFFSDNTPKIPKATAQRYSCGNVRKKYRVGNKKSSLSMLLNGKQNTLPSHPNMCHGIYRKKTCTLRHMGNTANSPSQLDPPKALNKRACPIFRQSYLRWQVFALFALEYQCCYIRVKHGRNVASKPFS